MPAGQLIVRQSANVVPAQIANEARIGLEKNETLQTIFKNQRTDFKTSQMPFIITYDQTKSPSSSTTFIDANIPQIPVGVLDVAQKNGDNRLTWQPYDSIRMATVSIPYQDGYIVAGQSLIEYEKIISELLIPCFVGWLIVNVSIIGLILYLPSKRNQIK